MPEKLHCAHCLPAEFLHDVSLPEDNNMSCRYKRFFISKCNMLSCTNSCNCRAYSNHPHNGGYKNFCLLHNCQLNKPFHSTYHLHFVSCTRSFSSCALFSSPTAANLGENWRICFSNKSIFLPAAIPTTCKSSFLLTISRVCVPMEPVEPKIAISSYAFLFILKHWQGNK